MPELKLVKVVRDHIADHLANPQVTYKPLDNPDLVVKELRKKLLEEAGEYLIDPSLEELADVIHVCQALAELDINVTWHDLMDEIARKNARKGPLMHGIGMFVTTLTKREYDIKARTR